MKNTMLLLALLTLSLCASGQTATTDSNSISIPKRWFQKATADLMRYDDCRQEVSLLKPRLITQQRLIEVLAEDTAAKAQYIGFLGTQLQSEKLLSAGLETNCNEQLQRYSLQAKHLKRQNTFRSVLVAIAAGSVGYFIHSLVH